MLTYCPVLQEIYSQDYWDDEYNTLISISRQGDTFRNPNYLENSAYKVLGNIYKID